MTPLVIQELLGGAELSFHSYRSSRDGKNDDEEEKAIDELNDMNGYDLSAEQLDDKDSESLISSS